MSSAEARGVQVASSASIWRRIRRDVILLGAGNVGVVVAQLAFRGILITALVPAAYGRLSLILSIYNTVWLVGASGLPNTVARYIALRAPTRDAAVIHAAIRAAIWPTLIATTVIGTVSGILLDSPLAFVFAAVGLFSLVYSLLAMGILRGRGRTGLSAAILPIAAAGEVIPLATLSLSGLGVTPLSAFGVFCFGNIIGVVAGVFFVMRTDPKISPNGGSSVERAPSSRELLRFSIWLGAAGAGVALLPLIIRLAAALDSYTVVAIVDVAIVLLAIPQRVGSVLVLAVVPHASQAMSDGKTVISISRRENLMVIGPFVLAAILVGFTPVVGSLFDAIGRSVYAKSADYLALALLAGPARILYGLVEGMLIAHGEGRFLAVSALLIAVAASAMILIAAALGSTVAAFAVFVAAFWTIYLVGLVRVRRLGSLRSQSLVVS